MNKVFAVADNIISSLGFTSKENFNAVINHVSGIRLVNNPDLSPTPFYASDINENILNEKWNARSGIFSKFEKLLILSVSDALKNIDIKIAASDKTIFILSTTKGNIDLLSDADNKRLNNQLLLQSSASMVANHFQNPNTTVVVSNACISGLAAIIIGKRLIQSEKYDNAIVMGADVLSSFVISGFQSLYAMSDEPCMPFDKHRKGINLGEACATVILSKDEKLIVDSEKIYINGTAMTNDANHISGPSRTGEELKIAISKSLQLSNLQPQEINFISAHGTATLFNDDMESKALHLAGMATTPVNSLKGYFGHTLGAAGVIESVISLHSLRNNIIVGTCNFSESGTAEIINVTSKNESKIMTHCMKTASGFGGCNAAAVFSKN